MSEVNNSFEKYSEIASAEMRKIISGIVIAIFGLAFKDNHFDFQSDLSLKYALVLFFTYMLIDFLQYLIGVYYANKQKMGMDEKHLVRGEKRLLSIFYFKFLPAFLGFFLTINSIIKIINI